MKTIINTQVPEFKVQAFQNGEFRTVTNEDIKGNGQSSSFTQLTSLLFALQSL